MNKKVRDLIELLEANGWNYARTKGDHHIFKKDGARRNIVVPGRPNDDLYTPFAVRILKEAGLTMDNFKDLKK